MILETLSLLGSAREGERKLRTSPLIFTVLMALLVTSVPSTAQTNDLPTETSEVALSFGPTFYETTKELCEPSMTNAFQKATMNLKINLQGILSVWTMNPTEIIWPSSEIDYLIHSKGYQIALRDCFGDNQFQAKLFTYRLIAENYIGKIAAGTAMRILLGVKVLGKFTVGRILTGYSLFLAGKLSYQIYSDPVNFMLQPYQLNEAEKKETSDQTRTLIKALQKKLATDDLTEQTRSDIEAWLGNAIQAQREYQQQHDNGAKIQ